MFGCRNSISCVEKHAARDIFVENWLESAPTLGFGPLFKSGPRSVRQSQFFAPPDAFTPVCRLWYQSRFDLCGVRWRKEYGGLQVDQAKRLKDLEQENAKLKRLVSELSLEKLVLKDIASGNF